MNKEKMGLFLSELRKERNLTLQDAGEIFLVSFQAISKWERGESVPDIAILEQLAKFYNVSIEEILNGERKVKEVQVEKVELKEENKTQINKGPKAILLDILFGSLFLLFIFFIGFFDHLEFEETIRGPFYNTFVTVSVNMYDLIFSSSYKIGNVFLMLSFVCFIASTIFCILCGTAMKKLKSGYICRRIFAYAATVCAMIYVTIISQYFVFGAIIYLLYILTYTFLVIVLKGFQEQGSTYDVSKKMRKVYVIISYVYVVIGIIILLSRAYRQAVFQAIFILSIGILSINEIVQRAKCESRIVYLSLMIISIVLSLVVGCDEYEDSNLQAGVFLIYSLPYIIFYVIYISIFKKKSDSYLTFER